MTGKEKPEDVLKYVLGAFEFWAEDKIDTADLTYRVCEVVKDLRKDNASLEKELLEVKQYDVRHEGRKCPSSKVKAYLREKKLMVLHWKDLQNLKKGYAEAKDLKAKLASAHAKLVAAESVIRTSKWAGNEQRRLGELAGLKELEKVFDFQDEHHDSEPLSSWKVLGVALKKRIAELEKQER